MTNITISKRCKKLIKDLCLLDNDFMRSALNHKASLELVLSLILHRKIRIKEFHTEHLMYNLHGRSVTFDAYIITEDNIHIDLEVQNKDDGAIVERARYHLSILDSNINPKGTEFKDIKKTLVIFITASDYFKEGKALYHISRYVDETGKEINDGSHIIYVNGSKQDETQLGKLMHDFKCTDYSKMYYEVLKRQMKYFKEGEGVATMCKKVEDFVRREAKREAKKEVKREVKRRLGKQRKIAEAKGRNKGRMEGRAEGLVEGLAEGRAEGRVEGLAKGRAEGELNNAIEMIQNLMRKNHLSASIAMEMLDIPATKQQIYLRYLTV